jgi:hypothetical protein
MTEEWNIDELKAMVTSIDRGVKKLTKSGISRRALILLIQHASPQVGGNRSTRKPRVQDIEAVLSGMEGLREYVFGEDE